MGWFDEQIKERIKNDDEQFEEAFARMAKVVMSNEDLLLMDQKSVADDAIKQILAHYRIRPKEVPKHITDVSKRMEYLMRPAGIMWNTVKLAPGWSKDAIGPMLIENNEGGFDALIPRQSRGYWHIGEKREKVSAKNESNFTLNAICFYRPLPSKKLQVKDLMVFIKNSLSNGDIGRMMIAAFLVTIMGLILPYANKLLFAVVVPSGTLQLLAPIAVLLLGVTLATLLIQVFKSLILQRLLNKVRLMVITSTMMRFLNLPLSFYKDYSGGELFSRMKKMNNSCMLLLETVFTTGLSGLFSLIYIAQIFAFAPSLTLPALIILAVSGGFSVVSFFVMVRWQKETLGRWAKNEAMTYALFSSVQKLKLTGAERRGFAKWAATYSQAASLEYNPPLFVRTQKTVSLAFTLFGGLLLYYFTAASKISPGDYMAFMASYGLVSGAFAAFTEILKNIAKIRPALEMARPILNAVPEVSEEKTMISRIRGGIELNNVSFRYDEDSPYILNELTLKIKSGQYVAVVGKTGCGKSTFIRMLLGFEAPERGAVFYDSQDISNVDLKSLRQQIGTVTQSGKLFEGTVFSNMAICAPGLTREDAWKVAEMSGLSDDISKMPMGMDTLISQGGGGLSGGQRQRLLIARAIALNPRVLIFDEATSALDNITQKQISDTLDSLKCTRIVVAHRLSTIQQCDRIVCLDGGKIIEDGTFDELIAQNGFFAELVSRQRQ